MIEWSALNTLNALRLDRDRELTGDIVPEAYFKCVAVRELAYPWPSHDAERQLTEIRAAWTEKFLYLHLWAKDSWITADDRLTVFLQRSEQEYLVWECSASGAIASYKALGTDNRFDRTWKTAAQSKIRLHDAGWVCELRIPFAKDWGSSPQRGETWGASFHRTDVDRRGRTSLSTFSDVAADAETDLHRTPFGQMVFS